MSGAELPNVLLNTLFYCSLDANALLIRHWLLELLRPVESLKLLEEVAAGFVIRVEQFTLAELFHPFCEAGSLFVLFNVRDVVVSDQRHPPLRNVQKVVDVGRTVILQVGPNVLVVENNVDLFIQIGIRAFNHFLPSFGMVCWILKLVNG